MEQLQGLIFAKYERLCIGHEDVVRKLRKTLGNVAGITCSHNYC